MANHHRRIFEVELDAGDVGHGHRSPVDPLDDHRFDILRRTVLTDGAGHVAALAFIEIAGTDVSIFYIQGPDDFRDGYFPGGQGIRVYDHVHLPLVAAVNVGRGNTGDSFQTGFHVFIHKVVFGQKVAFVSVQGPEHHPGNRLFTAAAGLDYGLVHIVRVSFDLVHFVGGSQQRLVRVGADFEHQVDVGVTIATFAVHLLQAVEILELLLLHVDDLTFHFDRAGSLPAGLDGHFRHVHVGGQLDGDAKEGQKTEKHEQNHPHCDGDRFADGGVDDVHGG